MEFELNETQRLFQVMRRVRNDGLGVIFITHFIEQANAVAVMPRLAALLRASPERPAAG